MSNEQKMRLLVALLIGIPLLPVAAIAYMVDQICDDIFNSLSDWVDL